MKRAPIVLAGTAAGLIGVLSYNTAASPSAVTAGSSSGPETTASTATTNTSTTAPATTTTTTSSSTTAARTRTATGEDVQYQYGDLQLKVTMTGTRITNIAVAKLDITDPRSQSIDEAAIPQLQEEAQSAQSAKIDGVSGASYTSAAYEQSLQSALDKLT